MTSYAVCSSCGMRTRLTEDLVIKLKGRATCVACMGDCYVSTEIEALEARCKALEEIAEGLFDRLHAIVYQVPTLEGTHNDPRKWGDKARATAIEGCRWSISKGFDPTTWTKEKPHG